MFFATRGDLLPVVTDPALADLVAVRCGGADHPEPVRIPLPELPDLGAAGATSSIACASWLVHARDTRLAPRLVRVHDRDRWLFDQLAGVATVTFTPGGVRPTGVMLHGRVATVWTDEPAARELLRAFQRSIDRRFARIRSFRVGPEAEALLDSGARLTAAEQSPPEHDLTRA